MSEQGLDETARERLADVVSLQPTKNGELQDRWGVESGSEVHQYLEGSLKRFYYRDDDSLIRATDEAADLVDVKPGIEGDGETGGPRVVRVPALQVGIIEVLAGREAEPQSVVSVLHDLRDAGYDPEVDDVRSALRSLESKGVATSIKKTVPTFRLAVDSGELEVESRED